MPVPDDPTMTGSPYPDDATRVTGRVPAFRPPPPPQVIVPVRQPLPQPQVVYVPVMPPGQPVRRVRQSPSVAIWVTAIVCATVIVLCVLFATISPPGEKAPTLPPASAAP